MKVAVISRVAHPLHGMGGFERHVGAMVRHLVRNAVEVTLYTSPPVPPADPPASTAGPPAPPADAASIGEKLLEGARVRFVPYRIVPWPRRSGFVIADRSTNYLAWSVRAARRMMAGPTEMPDIVQAEGAAGFGYALSRTRDDPPMVVHPVGMEEFKAQGLKRVGYLPLRAGGRYAARRAERVIVPDQVMMEEVRRYLGIEPAQAAILPTPIDLEEIDRPVSHEATEALYRRLGLEPSMPVLLSVGRLESYKGFSVLADALGRVRERLPSDWVWVLVGSGPTESSLRERIEKTGLTDRTRFAGGVSDEELSALYGRADLFVHPTLYEGSSLVTLEAMAHGKPVVATTAGGIPDKIEEGKSGFLVPPGEVEALGEAMVRALSLGEELASFGKVGRLRVESDFSWSERVGSLLDLYREILAHRR